MNKTLLAMSLGLALLTGTAVADSSKAKAAHFGSFGVDLSARDLSVKPGDDFNRYANGHWLDTYQLKDYEARYGSFNALDDAAVEQVRGIVEELGKRTDIKPGSDEQKVRDYYASYMNQAARDAAGITPIRPLLDKIAHIDSMAGLVKAFGEADIDGTRAPIGISLDLDRKDPSSYMVGIRVGGLGLPDKDYYLNPDPRFVTIRAAYLEHIQRMLGFAGISDSKARAEAILALETELAKPMWDRAQLRDREKTYNVISFADLNKQYPGYDWATEFKAQEMGLPDRVNVVTPSSVQPVLAIIAKTPLAVWRDYLTLHAVRDNAPLLSSEIDNAAFAFTGTVLQGQTAQRESWKRAMDVIGDTDGLGDAIGKIYVARYFTPEAKKSMDELVANLRLALRQNLDHLDWMGDATKVEAYKKLDSFNPKIGYTSRWREYGAVTIVPDNLVANVMAMRHYYQDDQNRRLGQKTDRDEWFMTPQTVNAYYNSTFNEIVFPVAILQPPFFDVNADPAVNYGAIGAVIGHEMGHGFDDQGSKSDWAGIQRNWWTDEDRARFDARTKALGEQFNGFCPIKGQCVNGQLTMGENIGDLGGLSMAYTAYHLSLHGKQAPVIDGLTGDQRFFLAFAQVWKGKYRDEAMVNLVKTNPHSPPQYRLNGPVSNFDPWYIAFNVKPGDAMYVAPEKRVHIW